jgi:hypothetical protein
MREPGKRPGSEAEVTDVANGIRRSNFRGSWKKRQRRISSLSCKGEYSGLVDDIENCKDDSVDDAEKDNEDDDDDEDDNKLDS